MTKYVCPNCKSFIEFNGSAVVVCSKCKIKCSQIKTERIKNHQNI